MTSSPLLPQSTALSEASPHSISELLSRDPEGFSRQDRNRIVSLLREQRAKWKASEASGSKIKSPKASKPALGSPARPLSAEDIGM